MAYDREIQRAYRLRHKDKINRWNREKRAEKRAFIAAVKVETGCQVCGYKKCAAALTFHHLDPNKKSFTIATFGSYSIERIQEEIAKCIVLCANCHTERHFEMGG